MAGVEEERRRRELVGLELDPDQVSRGVEVEVHAPCRAVLLLAERERLGDAALLDRLEVEVRGARSAIVLDDQPFARGQQALREKPSRVVEPDRDEAALPVEVQLDAPRRAEVVVRECQARRDLRLVVEDEVGAIARGIGAKVQRRAQ